jgi:Cyclic nucleotide-binding domain
VQLAAPAVWTTLALTIHADGRSDFQMIGASPFPRHWIYDHIGRLVAKSGLIDFRTWYRRSFGRHTPWGDEQSPALVTAVESALERQLSATIIGAGPRFVRLRPGENLVEQGEPGDGLFLLFDGVLLVLRDGRPVTEVGPGAVLGELALLDGGRRTATLWAVTACRVAVVPGDLVERGMLERVASRRHGETAA